MSEHRHTLAAVVAVLVALTLVLGGQALADATAPEVPNGALTGQAVGRAGFAYLTGLRKFAAALLWNRLDPLMHEYYGRVGLGKMRFMLPSINAIVALDPQFVEAYFVAPVILIDNGLLPGTPPDVAAERLRTGLELAKQGVDSNPKSGTLLASYAELLLTRAGDVRAAEPYARAAMAPDVIWRNDDDRLYGYNVLQAVFERSGDTTRAAEAKSVIEAILADPNATRNAPDVD